LMPLLVAVLGCLGVGFTKPSQVANGIVRGTLLDAHEVPVPGVQVFLRSISDTGQDLRTKTDANGKFRFEHLALGTFDLTLERDDFRFDVNAMLVTAMAETDADDLKIVIREAGKLSGRAFDENGKPLTGAVAEALWAHVGGLPIDFPSAVTKTNERGEFAFARLTPGEYVVRITPSPDFIKRYPTTYFPNAINPHDAAGVVVTERTEVTRIDIHLAPVGVRVRGRVVNAAQSSVRCRFVLIPRVPNSRLQPPPTLARFLEGNEFELWAVAPGSYDLYCLTRTPPPGTPREYQSPTEWSRTPLEVGSEDVEGVTVTLAPPVSLRGEIVVDASADGDRVDLSGIKVGLSYSENVPAVTTSFFASTDDSGEFRLSGLSEGTLHLSNLNLPDGWFVSHISQNGEDVTGSGLSVLARADSSVRIAINNRGGDISGRIEDRQNHPAPAARFVILPEPALRANPLFINSGTAYEKGAFKVANLPPGEYTLIAFPDEERFSTTFLRNLDAVQQYEQFGQHIHIDAGQTTQVTLVTVPN
jgi:hypothetical protein